MAPEKKVSIGKVVVIGGNGFLGHHIVKQALELWDCAAVASVDLRCQKNICEGATYHECDITDLEKLTAVFAKLSPDVVIHTASPVAINNNLSNEIFDKVNVGGTKSVIEACQATGVKALVYTSSASVITDGVHDVLNADERWPVIRGAQQQEYYTETKAAAEELALKANRANGSKFLTAAIRPAGIFGEGDIQFLAGLYRVYKTGRHNIQIGDNNNIYDTTYVGNVAHAHLLAAQRLLATYAAKTMPPDHEKVDGEAFFITNDTPIYFWDFARAVWRAAGNQAGTENVWEMSRGVGLAMGMASEIFFSIIQKPPTFTKQRATLAMMTRYYNITKAKTVLGYAPLWTLEESINRGVEWFVQEDKKGNSNFGQF